MSAVERSLLERVIACVRELPDRTLAELVAELTAAGDWSRCREAGSRVRSPAWAELKREAMRADACPPSRVADLLRGAAAIEEDWRRRSGCEVAWTGPTPPLSSLRRTEQALLEVVDAARHDLWLVSFAAYRIESVQGALVSAAARGCRVRLLLESELESDGKLSSGGIDSVPGEVASCCELYVWPREKRPLDERGRFGTLHAKCAVADGELLFIGSANLTEFAFELNIELGVLLRGGDAAATVQRQLQWLVETRTVERLP